MSKLRLHGTSSGYTDIAPTAAAGNNTLTAPTGTGTLVAQDAAGAIGITSVQATNANFSGTGRITTGITTTATINTATVGGVNVINSDGVNTTGIVTAATFVPTVGQLSNRNLIINGAMQVAQRGSSSTDVGYTTVDRMEITTSGVDEAVQTNQHALTSSDTGPWADGFRYSYYIKNGNQTSGAGAADWVSMRYKIEGKDLAQSGWNYTDPNSYITLSFWVMSSVAQTFYGYIRTIDGTEQNYPFSLGSLSANTWTKVTKTIPGNSNITVDNDTGDTVRIFIAPFYGTDRTASGVSLDTWAAYASGTRTPDNTSTWYTTNDATFEITGLQLEVGSVATPFEHRSYHDDLNKCKRYYQQFPQGAADNYGPIGSGRIRNATNAHIIVFFPEMRSSPTVVKSGNLRILHAATSTAVNSVASSHMAKNIIFVEGIVSSGLTQGEGCMMTANNDANGKITLSAEI